MAVNPFRDDRELRKKWPEFSVRSHSKISKVPAQRPLRPNRNNIVIQLYGDDTIKPSYDGEDEGQDEEEEGEVEKGGKQQPALIHQLMQSYGCVKRDGGEPVQKVQRRKSNPFAVINKK